MSARRARARFGARPPFAAVAGDKARVNTGDFALTAFSIGGPGVFASLAAAALAAASQAQAAALLPHRAVYELTLKSGAGAKAPTAASGLIAFDLQGSPCEGWTTSFRQVTEMTPSEGETMRSEVTSSTFEEADGGVLRFRVETRDPATQRLVQGAATRSPGGLSIALTKPMRQKTDLGDEAVFPTAHVAAVLKAAEEGKTLYEVKLFDGSDSGEKVYDTLTVIGASRADAAPEAAAQDAALKGVKRWAVRTSYFEPGTGDQSPIYTLIYDLYDNGVARGLTLDYGTFALIGELKEFKSYPLKACQ
jgi:hypothetical protein